MNDTTGWVSYRPQVFLYSALTFAVAPRLENNVLFQADSFISPDDDFNRLNREQWDLVYSLLGQIVFSNFLSGKRIMTWYCMPSLTKVGTRDTCLTVWESRQETLSARRSWIQLWVYLTLNLNNPLLPYSRPATQNTAKSVRLMHRIQM